MTATATATANATAGVTVDAVRLAEASVVVENARPGPVDLTDWTLANAANETYRFPDYTLAAGERVTVRVGNGTDGNGTLYWSASGAGLNATGETVTLRNAAGERALVVAVDEAGERGACRSPGTFGTSDGGNDTFGPVPAVVSPPPTDPDCDGLFEDLGGDGSGDVLDAADLLFALPDLRAADRDVRIAVDFDGDGDGDGDGDLLDAIELPFGR